MRLMTERCAMRKEKVIGRKFVGGGKGINAGLPVKNKLIFFL